MADFGSIDGRAETPGDGAGRLSASELRPVDAAGREWPAELVALVGAVVDVVEEGLETELAEARREADELRARVAALEAASIDADGFCLCYKMGVRHGARHTQSCSFSGGTSALDAVVSAAVAESRARTFRAAFTYVTGETHHIPPPDVDAEAKAFAAAVRERIAAAVAAERAAIRARVEALPGAITVDDTLLSCDSSPLVDRHGVLSAIDAIGGAP